MTDIKVQIDALSGVDPQSPLLEVTNLHVEFRTPYGISRAVNGANFVLAPGETLAILGESGCGKSVTAQAIMGILDSPPGFITQGEVRYRGIDLLKLSENERRKVRANKIAMIFQDALSALNPVFTVGYQLAELFRVHRGMSRADAKRRAIELLDQVNIPAAKSRVGDYPHQFSGGMRQRVMIAMALSCNPKLIIADEPTTALDVTIQAQILDLMRSLQSERDTGVIMITHSMGVVAGMADRVQVMYAGSIVETASTEEIFANPRHPYTVGLMKSIPRLDARERERLEPIRGLPPDLIDLPDICPFVPRCDYAREKCEQKRPPLLDVGPGHKSACWFWEEVSKDGVPTKGEA